MFTKLGKKLVKGSIKMAYSTQKGNIPRWIRVYPDSGYSRDYLNIESIFNIEVGESTTWSGDLTGYKIRYHYNRGETSGKIIEIYDKKCDLVKRLEYCGIDTSNDPFF